ncbi:uncharacterized protein LOC144158658 [Haemaphysalis longicornis]
MTCGTVPLTRSSRGDPEQTDPRALEAEGRLKTPPFCQPPFTQLSGPVVTGANPSTGGEFVFLLRNEIVAGLSSQTFAKMAHVDRFAVLRFYLKRASELSDWNIQEFIDAELQHKDFQESWLAAKGLYKPREKFEPREYNPYLTREQCWALTCYTLDKLRIHDKFEIACRSALPTQESWQQFRFKGLWCLLVGAFTRLPNYEGGTTKFYREMQEEETFERGKPNAFVHFVSASYSLHEATTISKPPGNVLTLKGVPPEYVRSIKNFAEVKFHDEVLIWPLCTYMCVDAPNKIFEFLEGELPPQEVGMLLVPSAINTTTSSAECATADTKECGKKLRHSLPPLHRQEHPAHTSPVDQQQPKQVQAEQQSPSLNIPFSRPQCGPEDTKVSNSDIKACPTAISKDSPLLTSQEASGSVQDHNTRIQVLEMEITQLKKQLQEQEQRTAKLECCVEDLRPHLKPSRKRKCKVATANTLSIHLSSSPDTCVLPYK